MIDWVLGLWANKWIALGLYWLPAAICVVGYTMRTARNYMVDKRDRETKKYYSPTDTIGSLIGRALVSFIPIGNLWAAMFDVSPEFFGRIFEWIGKVFDQPLVPAKPNTDRSEQ